MARFIDLTGQKFGKLTVIARAENKGRCATWRCKCECGNECVVLSYHLRDGHTKSCGCLRRKPPVVLNEQSREQLFEESMKTPCSSANAEKNFASIMRMMLEGLERMLRQYRIENTTGMDMLLDRYYQKAKRLLKEENERCQ